MLVGGGYVALAKTEIIIPTPNPISSEVQSGIIIATEFAKDSIFYDSTAGKNGIFISAQLAQTPLQPSFSANDAGIILSQQLAEEDALFGGRFAVELDLLKRLTLLARLNIWQALESVHNRTTGVQQLEREYADALAAAEEAKAQVVMVGNNAKSKIDILEKEISTAEADFFDALGNFRSEVAEEKYTLFVAKKQHLVVLKAEFGRFKSLNDRFNELLPQVKAKATALSKNREALIQGIQVDKDTAVRAGVVKDTAAK